MAVCDMLQYMDKATLGYTTQLNIRADLKLRGSECSWCSSVFYFGYLFWSWLSSYISVCFPMGKYLGASVALWGVVLATHAPCTNFGGLLTARFFLGVTEAAVAPGFSLITGMFYKTSEQPSLMTLWFLGNAVANVVSGLIAYGTGRIDTHIAAWTLSILILDKMIALHRTLENRMGVMDEGDFKVSQMLDALTDPQAWLLFRSIIINGFGFSEPNSLLLSGPSGLLQIFAIGGICLAATCIPKSRILTMIVVIVFAVVGVVLMNTLPHFNCWGRCVRIFLLGPFATSTPISLSLITSNATVSVMLFLVYCTGNSIGPQLFFADEAPQYPVSCLSGYLSMNSSPYLHSHSFSPLQ
ncbi:hypothetical protein N8T08_002499 [Aspergillus melleus]|uniref:Uncharacterized protein n=1 Tax=Aspergillus melleus TaxID=138277 RepID=A0ACC3ALS9_9EURO|nr:hypothetical protein N8T08_002499 [Aspergillus melleus]